MKIALITETYPPEINGVARTLQRLVSGLMERHHFIQLIRPWQGKGETGSRTPSLHELLVPGFPLPFYPSLQLGMTNPARLLAHWRKCRPDVIHIATEGPLGWAALLAAGRLNIPAASSYHTHFAQYGQHYGIGWLRSGILAYLRHFHNLTQTTFVPTVVLKSELGRRGFANVRILGRGVDAALFSPAKADLRLRQEWQVTPDGLVCLYVGRIAAEKNLPLAIEAFRRIQQEQPQTRFVLVGDGPLRPQLERENPDLIFAGHRSGEVLAAYYATADLFLFPSLTETFGNVVTEALASGLPLVAFRNAAAAQLLVHGQSALLAGVQDPSEFLVLAAAAGSDPHLRQRLGRAGRSIALEQGWPEIIGRYEQDLIQISQAGAQTAADRGTGQRPFWRQLRGQTGQEPATDQQPSWARGLRVRPNR